MPDPLTIIGGAAASLQLVMNIHSATIKAMSMYEGIRHLDALTSGLCDELGAFEHVLFLFRNEAARLGQPYTNPSQTRSDASCSSTWDSSSIEDLLASAQKSLDRLMAIYADVSKSRRVGGQIRKYYRTQQYKDTIKVLIDRFGSYVTILHAALRVLSE
jgi:hypothetical protein